MSGGTVSLALAEQLAAIKIELAEMRQTAATLRERDERRLVTIEAAIAENSATLATLARAQTRAIADTLRQRRQPPADKTGPDPAAGFADPGYQKDKQPRYPLNSEEEIRAAWSYIHEHRDKAEYSPRQVDEIEARIVAAWKAKIDPAGPPEAEEESSEEKTADPARDAKRAPEPKDKPGTRGKTKPRPDGVLGWLTW